MTQTDETSAEAKVTIYNTSAADEDFYVVVEKINEDGSSLSTYGTNIEIVPNANVKVKVDKKTATEANTNFQVILDITPLVSNSAELAQANPEVGYKAYRVWRKINGASEWTPVTMQGTGKFANWIYFKAADDGYEQADAFAYDLPAGTTLTVDYLVRQYARVAGTTRYLVSEDQVTARFDTGVVTAVELNAADEQTDKVVGIYSVDGRQLSKPESGINIVRYASGKSEKKFVK